MHRVFKTPSAAKQAGSRTTQGFAPRSGATFVTRSRHAQAGDSYFGPAPAGDWLQRAPDRPSARLIMPNFRDVGVRQSRQSDVWPQSQVMRKPEEPGETRSASGKPASSPEELLLCLLICACDAAPKIGASGYALKQSCVSTALRLIDKMLDYKSTIKAEVPYDMTQSPPRPIMSRGNPLEPTEYLPERVKHIPGFQPGTGMVRRPDAVIVQNRNKAPEQPNIRKVVEIKFPGDILSQAQRLAYQRIAGSATKLTIMTPQSCECDELAEEMVEVLEVVVQIVLLTFLVGLLLADDSTVIGFLDDFLIAPTLARIAALGARLASLAPRLAPLLPAL